MEQTTDGTDTLVLSYLQLRKAVGYLGFALPFVVGLGGFVIFGVGIQDSISGYYYTGMRNVFVGAIWAIGIFLLSYKGYQRKDSIAGNLACLFAIGLALFPTAPLANSSHGQDVIGHIHLAFASLFFSTLAYFSLCLFTKTKEGGKPTPRKLQRNRIYKVCGVLMVVCLILIAFVHFELSKEPDSPSVKWNAVFWLESVAIMAFGISWLTKGEAILKDAAEREP